MGKVVAFVSSSRERGNTDTIVGKVLQGAMGISTNYIKLYYTSKMRPYACDRCHKCKNTHRCIIGDSMADAIEDIRDADAVVVSTPVIFGRESWSLLSMIERLYALLDDDLQSTIPAGKELIIVVSYSYDTEAAYEVLDHLKSIFVDRFKFVFVGGIVYRDKYDGEDVPVAKHLETVSNMAYRMGSTLSISKPFGTYVVSIDENDPRRGKQKVDLGTVWTNIL